MIILGGFLMLFLKNFMRCVIGYIWIVSIRKCPIGKYVVGLF